MKPVIAGVKRSRDDVNEAKQLKKKKKQRTMEQYMNMNSKRTWKLSQTTLYNANNNDTINSTCVYQ